VESFVDVDFFVGEVVFEFCCEEVVFVFGDDVC